LSPGTRSRSISANSRQHRRGDTMCVIDVSAAINQTSLRSHYLGVTAKSPRYPRCILTAVHYSNPACSMLQCTIVVFVVHAWSFLRSYGNCESRLKQTALEQVSTSLTFHLSGS